MNQGPGDLTAMERERERKWMDSDELYIWIHMVCWESKPCLGIQHGVSKREVASCWFYLDIGHLIHLNSFFLFWFLISVGPITVTQSQQTAARCSVRLSCHWPHGKRRQLGPTLFPRGNGWILGAILDFRCAKRWSVVPFELRIWSHLDSQMYWLWSHFRWLLVLSRCSNWEKPRKLDYKTKRCQEKGMQRETDFNRSQVHPIPVSSSLHPLNTVSYSTTTCRRHHSITPPPQGRDCIPLLRQSLYSASLVWALLAYSFGWFFSASVSWGTFACWQHQQLLIQVPKTIQIYTNPKACKGSAFIFSLEAESMYHTQCLVRLAGKVLSGPLQRNVTDKGCQKYDIAQQTISVTKTAMMMLLLMMTTSRKLFWWSRCWCYVLSWHISTMKTDENDRWQFVNESFSASSYLFIFSLLSSCPLKAWHFPTFLYETVALQRSAVQPPSRSIPVPSNRHGAWNRGSRPGRDVAVVSLGRLTQLDFAGQLTRPASPKVVRQGGTSYFVMPFLPLFFRPKTATQSHNKSQTSHRNEQFSHMNFWDMISSTSPHHPKWYG